MPPIRLVMTLLVRDEADIVAENIEFHLAAGVDFVVAVDNGSVDGTREILATYENLGLASVLDEPGRDYSQNRWMTRAAIAARDVHGADWILNNDADEFWQARGGTLKDALRDTEADVLTCHRRNMFCAWEHLDDARWRENSLYHVTRPVKRPVLADFLRDPLPAPYFYLDLPPKVLVRAAGLTEIGMGNHRATHQGANTMADGAIDIYHFPIRGKQHFRRKVVAGNAALSANASLPQIAVWHWRGWDRMIREAGEDAALADALPDAARLEADLASGLVARDPAAAGIFQGLKPRAAAP